ncbi:hypothetical protein LTR36_003557 [Oleoguttula mirabilis]|uniref:SWR1-complex protein 5 n=1 Tax=Oleoguttula mirabilis TaxID=1507867 RepID=A0AAV9JJF3_9PEZI|nr:hypothetical protein LTR36_003557 [Oleoguttula mirabilis]
MAEPTALERDLREDEQEVYDENADEDFNPEQAAADDDGSSSDDEEVAAAKPSKEFKKRKSEAVDELDSGDEVTIQEQKRKRKKKKEKEAATADGEESGGEGGFVRTRAQRHAETVERKERKRTTTGEVTIDVDQIWAELNSVPIGRPPPPPSKVVDATEADGDQNKDNAPAPEDVITITRRIEYAGEVTEVQETVCRTSKEAKQYLKEHPEADPDYQPHETSNTQLRRPLKRPSIFEPNPTAVVKGVPIERLRPRAPSRFDVLMAEKRVEEEMKKKAEKMTTVQKSALDWKGFVDQQGLKAELDDYGKSKGGYLAREDFLGRADAAREDAARSARLNG